MIEGLVGAPGTGKTYIMTAKVLRRLRKQPRLHAFANFEIKHERAYRLEGPDDLLTCPPGLIAIDEVHMWFDSRMSMKLPPSFLQKLSYTRKSGWNMMWTSQHESNADKRVRDNTNFIWLCAAYFGVKSRGLDQGHYEVADFYDPLGSELIFVQPDPNKKIGHPLFFTARCFQPRDVERARGTQKGKVKPRRYGKMWLPFSAKVATKYGTFEQIQTARHYEEVQDVYRKKTQPAFKEKTAW